MLQIDLPSSLALGGGLALAARDRLKIQAGSWPSGAAMAYVGAIWSPALLYFLARFPAWDTMYLWDRENLPALLFPLLVLGVVALALAGFALGALFIRMGRESAVVALIAGVAAYDGSVFLAFWKRTLYVGSREGFLAGAPPNLLGHELMWTLLALGPWLALPWLLARRELAR